MGQTSSSIPSPLGGDDEEEFIEDKEYDEEQDREATEDGFNLLFSPELIRRLQAPKQGDKDDVRNAGDSQVDASESTQQHAYEKSESKPAVEKKNAVENRGVSFPKVLPQTLHREKLERQEDSTRAEIESIFESTTIGAQGGQINQKRCENEEEACIKCIEKHGLTVDCQKLIKEFDLCIKRGI